MQKGSVRKQSVLKEAWLSAFILHIALMQITVEVNKLQVPDKFTHDSEGWTEQEADCAITDDDEECVQVKTQCTLGLNVCSV